MASLAQFAPNAQHDKSILCQALSDNGYCSHHAALIRLALANCVCDPLQSLGSRLRQRPIVCRSNGRRFEDGFE